VGVSDTETIKRLLAPVVALDLPVLGAVSDAQESLCQAIAELWPHVPHQLCQFHYVYDRLTCDSYCQLFCLGAFPEELERN